MEEAKEEVLQGRLSESSDLLATRPGVCTFHKWGNRVGNLRAFGTFVEFLGTDRTKSRRRRTKMIVPGRWDETRKEAAVAAAALLIQLAPME